jgi:hypothetical protein
MTRVQVSPQILRWACERSRIDEFELGVQFPHSEDWDRGDKQPTLKQLETFAKATHTPIGYILLPEPPVERLSVTRAALEGRLSFKEAYDLTGFRGGAFQEYGRQPGVQLA